MLQLKEGKAELEVWGEGDVYRITPSKSGVIFSPKYVDKQVYDDDISVSFSARR